MDDSPGLNERPIEEVTVVRYDDLRFRLQDVFEKALNQVQFVRLVEHGKWT